jgi:gamma-glutamyl-gamma-aminobutyrate hydrolase PuuD
VPGPADADATLLVGVTTYRQSARWGAWDRDAALAPGAYLDMVAAAGGWPVLLAPGPAAPLAGGADPTAAVGAAVPRILDALDALVVIGGGDVAAERYGQADDPRNGGRNDRRDDLELALVDGALERDLPLLAICRGLQVLDVALGGTLVQHLPDVVGTDDHQPGPGRFAPVTVTTEPGSTVHRLLGAQVEVLCSHHQAVDRLGEGLMVTARSADGVIEAAEVLGRTFAVGVQWHPEESADVRLFAGLVDAARRRRPT